MLTRMRPTHSTQSSALNPNAAPHAYALKGCVHCMADFAELCELMGVPLTKTGGGANGGYSVTGPGWDSVSQDL